jgi:hypothetical protein
MNNAIKQWCKVFGRASSDYIVYAGLKMKRMMSQKFWERAHVLTSPAFRCILNCTAAWMSATERWMVCCELLWDKIAFQDPLRYQRASKW